MTQCEKWHQTLCTDFHSFLNTVTRELDYSSFHPTLIFWLYFCNICWVNSTRVNHRSWHWNQRGTCFGTVIWRTLMRKPSSAITNSADLYTAQIVLVIINTHIFAWCICFTYCTFIKKYINIKYLRLHTNSTVITYCLYTIDTIKQMQQYTKSTREKKNDLGIEVFLFVWVYTLA